MLDQIIINGEKKRCLLVAARIDWGKTCCLLLPVADRGILIIVYFEIAEQFCGMI
jgi:hypothetical protein